MDSFLKLFFGLIFLVILIALFVWLFAVAMTKGEIAECMKWQQQANQYPLFFMSDWQKAQCEAHNIIVNAQVK